jgi:hypothetical protein
MYNVTTQAFLPARHRQRAGGVVFAAFVPSRRRRCSPGARRAEWLAPTPRARGSPGRASARRSTHVRQLLAAGHAGPLEDVLRVR